MKVLTLPLKDIFSSIAEVDQLVDNPGGYEVERRFTGLVKVVCDEGIHPNAQVIVHQDCGSRKPDPQMPPWHNLYPPPIHRNNLRPLNPGHGLAHVFGAVAASAPT